MVDQALSVNLQVEPNQITSSQDAVSHNRRWLLHGIGFAGLFLIVASVLAVFSSPTASRTHSEEPPRHVPGLAFNPAVSGIRTSGVRGKLPVMERSRPSVASEVSMSGSEGSESPINTPRSRRDIMLGAAGAASLTLYGNSLPVSAAEPKVVAVAGATGQTGRRVLERLVAKKGLTVIGGVRDIAKAEKALSTSSTQVRGAMLDKVAAVDASAVQFRTLDVEKMPIKALVESLKGADSLVIATGFVPGNPFKMNAAAHAVDNLGTIALVDAAKEAGVKKVVLVTSILTDAGEWGQKGSAGYKITNAFGNVLEEKLVAEKYLRSSGLDWTIVRPGGLKADAPTGKLLVSGENTLNSGEISRDLVADVCIDSLSNPKSSNKVLEIIEQA